MVAKIVLFLSISIGCVTAFCNPSSVSQPRCSLASKSRLDPSITPVIRSFIAPRFIRSDGTTCQSSSLSLPKKTMIHMKADDSASLEGDDASNSSKIRYLGSGENAIVRPGCVLVAPTHEYDHFLMKSAVFIHAIGLDDTEEMVIRGVIIDHPTAFTVGEMSPNIMGNLSNNLLFRGGRTGRDTAMLLHSAGGPDGPIKSSNMIGSSGIYEGGIVSAMESVDSDIIPPEQCKFFFNYMEFTEKELNDMFADMEDGDAWVSLEVPPEFVLDSNLERGQMWSRLRNYIRSVREKM
mmetsp:Transcript_12413/g.26220  ORF Transcript_12413/g.26220 Transcript_12413/m.26220 type:complete len:293 (-) Transcript_12413:82-960(-)